MPAEESIAKGIQLFLHLSNYTIIKIIASNSSYYIIGRNSKNIIV